MRVRMFPDACAFPFNHQQHRDDQSATVSAPQFVDFAGVCVCVERERGLGERGRERTGQRGQTERAAVRLR